jgi:hypothetical protein
VLRLVLPLAVSASIVPLVPVTVDISVDINVLVNVDINTATTVPVPMSPCIPPCNADSYSGCETVERWPRVIGRIVIVGRIVRIPPCSVHNGRVVDRYVDNLRTCRFDDDDFLLHLDNLLLGRLEVAGLIRLLAEIQNCLRDVLLL